MSNKREREKRREERLREEQKGTGSGEQRTRLLQIGAGAVFLAIVAVVVLIIANSGGDDSGGDASNLKEVSVVEKLFAGIPQQGLVLGDPGAKVELVEYGDLQCPVCKQFAEEILPPVVENQVRSGDVKVIFRNYPIIGPQSAPAGAAALAAGAQGKGWQFLDLFYHNQGAENSGYADDAFLTAIAEAVGVPNIDKWNSDRKSAKFEEEVEDTNEEAERLGLTGTPSLAIKGPSTDGTELLGSPGSGEALEELVEEAS
ncbi:MAG TPA: thioredoxin domain-containing protein [Solirubrobacterales bacterium]|nr:thioredoxin domain-containing protein [Solirubrobacterales bacterium]